MLHLQGESSVEIVQINNEWPKKEMYHVMYVLHTSRLLENMYSEKWFPHLLWDIRGEKNPKQFNAY